MYLYKTDHKSLNKIHNKHHMETLYLLDNFNILNLITLYFKQDIYNVSR